MIPTRLGWIVGGVITIVIGLFTIWNFIEVVGPSEYVRIQYPNGGYKWFLSPGPKMQWFGDVVRYTQRGTIFFKNTEETGDDRLPIVFNDAGKGFISGSINYELPNDETKLNEIHRRYPSQASLEESLVKPALNKSVYLTGTLMSSYESYKDRRSQLVQYVDDTVQNGVYQTDSREVTVTDELDPTKTKRATVVEILKASTGQFLRVDQGQLNVFSIRTFNFAIEDMDYDERVDAQIQGQQQITMQVQTAIAQAVQANQQKLTAEAEGAANAAKAKWEQETVNSRVVAEADGRRLAAEQDKLAAEQEKQARILRAEGESTARRLVMTADGALDRKLQALEKINQMWALSFEKGTRPLTPSIVMGSGCGTNAVSGAQELMNLLTIQTARQLGVDVTPGAK